MELKRCNLEKKNQLVFFLLLRSFTSKCTWLLLGRHEEYDAVCLTKSNKFPVTFSLPSTFVHVQNFFFYCGSNQFVRPFHSFSLSSYITRPINLRYRRITSTIENYSFFLFSLSLFLFRPTIECVCVTRKQSLTIASLHHSGAYKGLLFHYLHSPEKLIDDDVKSDISNSIKSEARMSSRDSRKQMKNGNTRLSY